MQIDGFEIEITQELTNRKFGNIQFGRELNINRDVIIKEITHPSQLAFLLNGGADALLAINHHNLPKTLAVKWLSNQKAIMVREQIKGLDLKSILAQPHLRKQLTISYIVSTFCQLLEALEYLHAQGLIHQDIKPSNIIINLEEKMGSTNNVALIDLEQSKFSNSNTTSPFALIYSAPEQMLKYNHLIDERADIYALGITLYETLTHKRPFEHYDPEFALNLQLTYPLKNDHNIDKNLYLIIEKATKKTPFPRPPHMLTTSQTEQLLADGINQRYQSARLLREALQEWQPDTSKRSWWRSIF